MFMHQEVYVQRVRKLSTHGAVLNGEGLPAMLPFRENAPSAEEVLEVNVDFRSDCPPSSCIAVMTVSMMPSKMRRMTGSATSGSTSPASKRTSCHTNRWHDVNQKRESAAPQRQR